MYIVRWNLDLVFVCVCVCVCCPDVLRCAHQKFEDDIKKVETLLSSDDGCYETVKAIRSPEASALHQASPLRPEP